MKKIILLLIAFMILAPLSAVSVSAAPEMATVVNPITGERKAVDVGDPTAFDGGFVLEMFLFDEDALGYSVVTNYKTTVNTPMGISQDYIPVSSLTTKDDHVLTIDDVDRAFLVIEPGKRKEEIVLCTSLNSSTVRWTDCTRGLAFYGKSLASVQDNIKTHSSGSIVVMSNTHQVYDQFINKDDDQTIGGDKWFTGTTTFSKLPIATSTITPWDNKQLTPKKYVDDIGASGFTSSNASTTNGLETYGTFPETVGINASTTSGLDFNTDGSLEIVASSTGGIKSDSNGVAVDGSDNFFFSGNNSYSGNSTFTGLVTGISGTFGYGHGIDGASTTAATTTLDRDYYFTNLSINSGVTLYTGGYKIFVNGTLSNNGAIDWSGNDGSDGTDAPSLGVAGTGGAGGTTLPSGSILGGVAGGAGGNGSTGVGGTGSVGISTTDSIGVVGVVGGDGGDGGTFVGGDGGAAGSLTGVTSLPYDFVSSILMRNSATSSNNMYQFSSGSGGGGGGGGNGGGNAAGGGGGGSGSTGGGIAIYASTLINNGTISATGGDGGNGGEGWLNIADGGGGSGGSGGVLVLVYNSYTNNGTINLSGGAGGSSGLAGGATAGNSGTTGLLYELDL